MVERRKSNKGLGGEPKHLKSWKEKAKIAMRKGQTLAYKGYEKAKETNKKYNTANNRQKIIRKLDEITKPKSSKKKYSFGHIGKSKRRR
jgi:hypothetical protein